MGYPAYPEGEHSGVGWIGRKPKHWQVMKLHHVVRMRSGSAITTVEMDDGEYPVFGGNGVRGKLTQYTHDGSYVLIGRQGAECGNINYAHGKFWASEHAVVATPDRDLDYRWFGETLRAMNLNQYSQAAAQPGLSVEVIGRLKLPFPPLDEQRQIAAFLDWKTGQIDALIARKRELLERLKEKRLAVITQAVTRGLNRDAAMQDSGVPWIGLVPEHWEVKRLRRFVDSIEQGWSPECDNRIADPDDWGVVKAGCCNGGRFNPEDNKALPPELEPPEYLEIKAGDLLMSRASGSEELIGSAALVPPGTRRKLLLSDKTYRLRYDGAVLPAFLGHTLQSPMTRYQIQAIVSGATGLARNIAQGDVKNLIFAIPTVGEQCAIVEFLDREAGRIEELTGMVTAAIARLTEYRTALITAATTGKIDVRNVKIPQVAEQTAQPALKAISTHSGGG